jgi:hypothetical protein
MHLEEVRALQSLPCVSHAGSDSAANPEADCEANSEADANADCAANSEADTEADHGPLRCVREGEELRVFRRHLQELKAVQEERLL